jgi:hypothetical protein
MEKASTTGPMETATKAVIAEDNLMAKELTLTLMEAPTSAISSKVERKVKV